MKLTDRARATLKRLHEEKLELTGTGADYSSCAEAYDKYCRMAKFVELLEEIEEDVSTRRSSPRHSE